ncbi:MAG: hypothetical protein NZ820_14810 [Dehalococcoidia bacterium]|nr:hypothetical protein [Dehalococcoidia bacterium]
MSSHDAVGTTGRIRTLPDDWPDSVDVLVLLERFTSLDVDYRRDSCVNWHH